MEMTSEQLESFIKLPKKEGASYIWISPIVFHLGGKEIRFKGFWIESEQKDIKTNDNDSTPIS